MTEMQERTAHPGETNVFDLTRRGYDRGQVDDHVQSLLIQLAETEQARQREEGRANRAEADLAQTRERLRAATHSGETQRLRVVPDPEPADTETSWSTNTGFGRRLENVLRAAEQEAADTVANARHEAQSLIDQAYADAEAYRYEVEQALMAHTAEVDRDANLRTEKLDERERHIGDQYAAACHEAERLLTESRRRVDDIEAAAYDEAERLMEETRHWVAEVEAAAHRESEDLLARTDHEAGRRQTASEAELDRLRELRHGVRGDLGRLFQWLSGEFERTTTAPPSAPEPRSGAMDAPTRAVTPLVERPNRHAPEPTPAAHDTGHDGAVRTAADTVALGGGVPQDRVDDGPFGGYRRSTGADHRAGSADMTASVADLTADDDVTGGDAADEPPRFHDRSRTRKRPPPGPGHLQRTGHGGYGEAGGEPEYRSRWFDDDVIDPVGLPGPVTPHRSVSLAGPLGGWAPAGPAGQAADR